MACFRGKSQVGRGGRDEVGALVSESSALSRERPETAGAVVAAGAARDALDSLLDVLAAVYDVFPDLWLDSRLRCAHLSHHFWQGAGCGVGGIFHDTSGKGPALARLCTSVLYHSSVVLEMTSLPLDILFMCRVNM